MQKDPYCVRTNKGPIPNNIYKYDKNDAKILKSMSENRKDLLLYNSSGHSMNFQNFYQNNYAFLILSGPSLKEHNLDLLKHRRGIMTMGVNNSWSVFKPNLWTSVDDPGNFSDIGWRDPSIMKFAPLSNAYKYIISKKSDGTFQKTNLRCMDLPSIWFFHRNAKFQSKSFFRESSINWGAGDKERCELGCKGGRSVMLVALRLLHYLGFKRVFLLGADFYMQDGEKQNYAFEQNRSKSSIRGNNNTYRTLNKRLTALMPEMLADDFKVYNCNKKSHLQVFSYFPFEDAVEVATKHFPDKIDTKGHYDRKEQDKEYKKNQSLIDDKKETYKQKENQSVHFEKLDYIGN